MKVRISRQEWAWGLKVSIPVALCLAAGALAMFGEEEDRVLGRSKLVSAGFSGKWGEKAQGRRMRTREARDVAVSQMRLRKPVGIETSVSGVFRGDVDADLEGLYRGLEFGGARTSWEYLDGGARAEIDSAELKMGAWSGIVIHGSGTAGGSAATLGYYHRTVRGLKDGMAYHFVIGNGSHAGLGEIEVGERWLSQTQGKLSGRRGGGGLIEICMIGDFSRNPVPAEQLKALDELIEYIRAKVGVVPVEMHEPAVGNRPSCLGNQFPRALVSSF